ncbi:MAG: glycosyltransferase family 2 protein [Gammaproteobacteria bacterium]
MEKTMMLDEITPLILTYNEEPNLERVLKKLYWAKEIVILDSGSHDATLEIARSFPNVRVVTRAFDSHAVQWNYGLRETGIGTEWVLALDADYVLADALIDEIVLLKHQPDVQGYRARFRYCLFGKPLSGSLYPPVVVLYRRRQANYRQDGHTQRLSLQGNVAELNGSIFHDDRKPLSRWLISQDRYARLECDLLANRRWDDLSWQDRIRKMIFVAPVLVPIYCLTLGKGFLDGRRGLYYALQRGIAESLLALKLLENKFSNDADKEL